MTSRPLLLLAPGLAHDVWEHAAFASMVAEAIISQWPNTILVRPNRCLHTFATANSSERELECSLSALTFGLVTEQLVSTVLNEQIRNVLAIGSVSDSIAEALVSHGAQIQGIVMEDALADPMTPAAQPSHNLPLTRSEARTKLGIPQEQEIELAFPSVDVGDVLVAIRRLAKRPADSRPLLVLADHWPDADRIRQHALLHGLDDPSIRFCGHIAAHDRLTVIAAANVLHVPFAAGKYRGEAARHAALFGVQLRARGDLVLASTSGELAQWAQWAIGTPTRKVFSTANRVSRVAVFLPSWNCRQWLPSAISSMTAQSYPELHIFVCFDGGADLDEEVLQGFPHASFLSTSEIVGPYAIANMLLAITQSDLVAFQDADDFSEPERISTQVEELYRQGLDAIGCNSRVLDVEGDLIGVEMRPPAASSAMRRTGNDVLLHPTSVFQRELLRMLGGFDSSTRFGADTELHFRAALAHDLGNVQQLLYTRRERPSSLTHSRTTGFGSDARATYFNRVRGAFNEALATAATATPGQTLTGQVISAPDFSKLRLVRRGTACDSWLSQTYADVIRA